MMIIGPRAPIGHNDDTGQEQWLLHRRNHAFAIRTRLADHCAQARLPRQPGKSDPLSISNVLESSATGGDPRRVRSGLAATGWGDRNKSGVRFVEDGR